STSSSAQMSCRLPVPWSMRTIGWRLASDLARLVMGTTPVRLSAAALSRPGTCTMMALPGLNPSLRFQAAGLIRTPLVLTGMAAAGRLTRSLVALVRSALVSRLSGNGNRHGLPEYGWHDDAAPARPLASADPAPAARTTRAAAVAADRSAVRAHGPNRWRGGRYVHRRPRRRGTSEQEALDEGHAEPEQPVELGLGCLCSVRDASY